MLNTNIRPNNSPAQPPVYPTSDPVIREKRVRELQNLTVEEHRHLLIIIKAIIPREFCEASDALNEGLLIALRKYDGRALLKAYVCRCAILYAFDEIKRKRRYVAFSSLAPDDDLEDYLDEVAQYLDDPRYVEGIDELFIRRIEEILAEMSQQRLYYTTPQALRHANQMLAIFRRNANLDTGIGIDEYDDTPPNPRWRRKQPTHNTKVVRRLLSDHLAEEFQTHPHDIHRALKALRLSTLQAIHEGWLPT